MASTNNNPSGDRPASQQIGFASHDQKYFPIKVSNFLIFSQAQYDSRQPGAPLEEGDPPEKKQIYTYESDWTLYSINFSNKNEKEFRLSLGSFIEDTQNKIEIIKLNEDKGDFERCCVFDHEYPPTKIMWIPDLVYFLAF